MCALTDGPSRRPRLQSALKRSVQRTSSETDGHAACKLVTRSGHCTVQWVECNSQTGHAACSVQHGTLRTTCHVQHGQQRSVLRRDACGNSTRATRSRHAARPVLQRVAVCCNVMYYVATDATEHLTKTARAPYAARHECTSSEKRKRANPGRTSRMAKSDLHSSHCLPAQPSTVCWDIAQQPPTCTARVACGRE